MAAVGTANAAHVVWGRQCDGWYLLDGDELAACRALLVEARIRLCEDRFSAIRRPIVVPWAGEAAEIGTAQTDSQRGRAKSDRLLGVIEQCMPPGSAEVRHRHARAPVVLRTEGTAALEHDGVDHRLAARPGEHVPPGSAHQMRNDSTAQLRFLEVSSPRSHGDREAVDD